VGVKGKPLTAVHIFLFLLVSFAFIFHKVA